MSFHLAPRCAYTSKMSSIVAASCLLFPLAATGQMMRGGGQGQQRAKSKGAQVPFPFLARIIKFPVTRLSKKNFIEMGAVYNTLPKGFGGKLRQDQQVVLLSYGYKKGGIVRIFETPAVPGTNPVELTKLINSSGFFSNVARGDWKLKSVSSATVMIVPTSESPDALDLAVHELTGH